MCCVMGLSFTVLLDSWDNVLYIIIYQEWREFLSLFYGYLLFNEALHRGLGMVYSIYSHVPAVWPGNLFSISFLSYWRYVYDF